MEIIGALFIIVFGTLGHFIFEWSGHCKWAGLFFAVNESTWEHIKLTIYPSLIWMAVCGCAYGWTPLLLLSQTVAMVTMIVLIPAIFYAYTAIIGKNFLIADIAVFIVSILAGMFVFGTLIHSSMEVSALMNAISIAFLAVITLAYLTFSYNPPHLFLFKDPVTGGFGPTGHDCDADFHGIGHEHHHHHSHPRH